MSIVSVKSLRKSYGKIKALDDVSIDIPEGHIYGLIGPNGAGKTTLIRALTGSLRPTSGSITALGLNPIKDKWKLREQIGYMPQSYALYDDLSARNNIAFFGRAKKVPDLNSKIKDILEFTELSDRASDPVSTFSGGMKKRVSLACALIHNPKILFLDEPTAAIDPHLKLRSWELFKDLASKGVTIFICTHLMDEALLCDNITILLEGKIIASDAPHNILDKGRSKIMIESNGKKQELESASDPVSIANALHSAGLPPGISSLDIQPQSLESIVLSLINKSSNKGS